MTQKPRSIVAARRPIRAAVAAAAAAAGAMAPGHAAASAVAELVGPLTAGNGLNARVMARHTEAAYFNPALLPGVDGSTDAGLSVMAVRANIRLDPRPPGVDVPSSIYDARIQNPDGSTSRLELRPLPTAELPSPRRDTALRDETTYVTLGVARPLSSSVTFGFYGVLPVRSFHRQQSFFPDEREQYFSNQLGFELLGDRMEAASFAVALGAQLMPELSVGAGVDVTIATRSVTAVHVPDAGDQRQVLLNPDVSVESVFSPYFGLAAQPSRRLTLSATAHLPIVSDMEGENRIRFFNYTYPEGEDSIRQRFTASTGYLPLRASTGGRWASDPEGEDGWELGGHALLSRWSTYRDRHGERPADGFRNTVAVGVGAAKVWRQRRVTGDVMMSPSPVPDQKGRSNYVDNARWMASLGFETPVSLFGLDLELGGYLHGQVLVPRRVTKSPSARHPVIDELPDGATDVITGAPLPGTEGLQTNNPGYPGFSSDGWLLGAGFSLRLPD